MAPIASRSATSTSKSALSSPTSSTVTSSTWGSRGPTSMSGWEMSTTTSLGQSSAPNLSEMEEHPRIESQRRYIERRADELLERIPFMGDTELRWTVRVFRDCLSAAAQEEMLGDYSEYLELHQMRQVVKSFIPRYTEHALEALQAKRLTPAASLRDLTDEELQAMSAAEKRSEDTRLNSSHS